MRRRWTKGGSPPAQDGADGAIPAHSSEWSATENVRIAYFWNFLLNIFGPQVTETPEGETVGQRGCCVRVHGLEGFWLLEKEAGGWSCPEEPRGCQRDLGHFLHRDTQTRTHRPTHHHGSRLSVPLGDLFCI